MNSIKEILIDVSTIMSRTLKWSVFVQVFILGMLVVVTSLDSIDLGSMSVETFTTAMAFSMGLLIISLISAVVMHGVVGDTVARPSFVDLKPDIDLHARFALAVYSDSLLKEDREKAKQITVYLQKLRDQDERDAWHKQKHLERRAKRA